MLSDVKLNDLLGQQFSETVIDPGFRFRQTQIAICIKGVQKSDGAKQIMVTIILHVSHQPKPIMI